MNISDAFIANSLLTNFAMRLPKAVFLLYANWTKIFIGSLAQLELEIPQRTKKKTSFDGIFLILLINLASYAADHWFQVWNLTQLDQFEQQNKSKQV